MRMEQVVQTAVVWAVTTALSAACGWFGGRIKGAANERGRKEAQRERDRDETRSTLRILLYFRLCDLFERYVSSEDPAPISSAQKHEVEELYTLYKGVGGNGEGSRKYRILMDLKTND